MNIPNTVPPEKWCDFRVDYESGMTLREISEKYCCDPRTVRGCIQKNKSSCDLGHKSTPTILASYEHEITKILSEHSVNTQSICQLSRLVTNRLQKSGYHGSERTVRNYLNTLKSSTP